MGTLLAAVLIFGPLVLAGLWYAHAPPFTRPSAATVNVCSTFNEMGAYTLKHPDPTTDAQLTAVLSYVANSLAGLNPPGQIREAVNATRSGANQIETLLDQPGRTEAQLEQAAALTQSFQANLKTLESWQHANCTG